MVGADRQLNIEVDMRRIFLLLVLMFALESSAFATWSVIAVDRATGRVVIASATCTGNSDDFLKNLQAVVVPGFGVAACQAGADGTHQNQTLVFEELKKGTDPNRIIELLSQDPRFQSRLGRGRYYDELAPIFDGIFQTRPADEWMDRLTSAGVPCSPVHDANGLVAHRQLWDNAMLVETEHPTKGPVIDTGVLIKLSETPGEVRGPAPLFGQHTDEVLREAGYTEDQITGLRATGVVA